MSELASYQNSGNVILYTVLVSVHRWIMWGYKMFQGCTLSHLLSCSGEQVIVTKGQDIGGGGGEAGTWKGLRGACAIQVQFTGMQQNYRTTKVLTTISSFSGSKKVSKGQVLFYPCVAQIQDSDKSEVEVGGRLQ